MKCIKCGAELKEYDNDKFCRKCGYPLDSDKGMRTFPLRTLYFDAETTKTLWVNGHKIDRLTAFEVKCNNRECSLVISADEEYKTVF